MHDMTEKLRQPGMTIMIRSLSTIILVGLFLIYFTFNTKTVYSNFQSLYQLDSKNICSSHFDLLARLEPNWNINQSNGDLNEHIKTSMINLKVYNECFIRGKVDAEDELDKRLIPFVNHEKYPTYTHGDIVDEFQVEGNYWRGLYSKINGAGIVIGITDKSITSTIKLLNVLKHLENELPIQIVHAGISQESLDAIKSATSLDNVLVIDVTPSVTNKNIPIMWFASLFNTFEEMIYMDPEVVPFVKPSTFLQLEKYKKHGAYFFKDIKQLNDKLSYETKAFYESILPGGVDLKTSKKHQQQHLKHEHSPDELHNTNDRFNDHEKLGGEGFPGGRFGGGRRGRFGGGRRGGPQGGPHGGPHEDDHSLRSIFRHRTNNINNGLFVVNRSKNFAPFLVGLTMQSWKNKFTHQKDILWLSHLLAGSDYSVNKLFPGISGTINKEYRVNSICASHQSYFTDEKTEPELLWIHGDLLGYHNLNATLKLTCEKTLLNIEGAILPSLRPFKDFVQSSSKCANNDDSETDLGASTGNYYCAYIHERFHRRFGRFAHPPRGKRVHRLVNFTEDVSKVYNGVVKAWDV